MRIKQTDQRGNIEIAIHPIENDPIPVIAETSLTLPSCCVDLYSIALLSLAGTKEYTPVCLSHTSNKAINSFSLPFVLRFLKDEGTIRTFSHNRRHFLILREKIVQNKAMRSVHMSGTHPGTRSTVYT
jgi:hypothetical protein